MSKTPIRPILAGGVAAITAAAAFVGVPLSGASPRSHDVRSPYGASAGAYGSTISLADGTARSGHSAITTLGCTTRAGVDRQNTTDRSNLSTAGTAGATSTRTRTVRPDGGGLASVSDSKVAGLDLFGGALTAKTVHTTATVTGGSTLTNTGSTIFDDLEIAGHRIDFQPKPNQTLSLPGIGTVTLNAQKASTADGETTQTVNGLEVKLFKGNPAGLPAGSHVVVGHARAALHDVASAPLRGLAYGSEITNGDTVVSTRSFAQILPCEGTDHHPARNRGAGLDVVRALHVGAVTSTATGATAADGSHATTRSSVADVALLRHLVTARAVTAVAHIAGSGGDVRSSERGSHIVGLRVAGKPVDVSRQRNTAIKLPAGIGTLYLDRVTTSPNGLTVHMIDLHLTQARDGLAKGTDILIGNAVAALAH